MEKPCRPNLGMVNDGRFSAEMHSQPDSQVGGSWDHISFLSILIADDWAEITFQSFTTIFMAVQTCLIVC